MTNAFNKQHIKQSIDKSKNGDEQGVFEIDGNQSFEYTTNSEQRGVFYFNDAGLTLEQRDAFVNFAQQLTVPTFLGMHEPVLTVRFNLVKAVSNMMETAETAEQGVYEAARKEDFDELRNDLLIALAKIEAMKFQ